MLATASCGAEPMRLRFLCAAAMLALPASQAAALSCMEYSIRDAFWSHDAREGTYELVYGRFSALRDRRDDRANDQVVWRATFTGFRHSARAFNQPLVTEVTITDHLFTGIAGGESSPEALANWLPGQNGLVFLKQTLRGYTAETALCEPIVDTSPASIRPALDCLNRRNCPKPA